MSRIIDLAAGVVVGCVACAGWAAAAGRAAQDPVKVSPHLYTVRLDNDRVRVLEYRLAPGGREARHDHEPFVVYFLDGARVRSTAADGTASESVITRGDVGWRDATTHAIENVGATDVRALIVEPRCR